MLGVEFWAAVRQISAAVRWAAAAAAAAAAAVEPWWRRGAGT